MDPSLTLMLVIILWQKFLKVDLEILNQVDQKHQILQNFVDAISERLASVIRKLWSYETKNLTILKNYMKNY